MYKRQTIYSFVAEAVTPNNLMVTQKQVYQGASTLLETTQYCYNTNQSNCATTAISSLPITQMDTYKTLAGMSSSNRATVKYDSYGNMTEKDVYDFGASTPYQKTVASGFGYTWNGSTSSPNCTSLIGDGIMDKPCQVQLLTGTGTQLKNTYTQYSSTGHKIKTGILVNGSYVIATATYNANGSVATVTDPNNQETTITEGACNGGFPTVISPPISSLAIDITWDSSCYGAQPVTITDPNSFSVSMTYADPFWRVTSVEDQAGVYTNTTYISPTQKETVLNFNSGKSIIDVVSTVFLSSTSSETQSLEGPSSGNWDTNVSDFVWDSTGIKNESYLPCVASSKGGSCTGAKSTVTHAALGRPLVKTDGGSGVITYSYIMGSSVYDVLAVLSPAPAGESVKQVQKEYNGLGQLLSSCKISSATGSTSCGQTNGGSGFVTTFTYNTDGTLQKSVKGSQTHSATYDNTGRVLTSVTPEGGTKQLFYDSAPSTPGVACSTLSLPTNYTPIGHLLKTYDANGTTTCFSYDQMGRNTGIAYSGTNWDGVNKYFIYDAATVNSVACLLYTSPS